MKKCLALFVSILLIFSAVVPGFAAGTSEKEDVFACQEKLFSDAYMLASLDEPGVILAQKNETQKKYPASLTKIVTAMVVLENTKDLHKSAVVSKRAIKAIQNTGAQNVNLKAGQRASIEELLYLSLVFSACDASQVLAENVGGTVKNFVKMMNEWVRGIGCQNTHFVNPEGLHDKRQYSTAEDLYRITVAALKNEDFVRISSTVSYRYRSNTYYHTNHLLHRKLKEYYPYAQGIKTGYTKQAGRCLITTAKKGNYSYLLIILDAPLKVKKDKNNRIIQQTNTSYLDAKVLFEWAFDHWSRRTIADISRALVRIPVEDSRKVFVSLCAKEEVKALLPNALELSAISVKTIDSPKRLTAPLKQGQEVCRAKLMYGERELAQTTLMTTEKVRSSPFKKLYKTLSKWFEK